MEKNISGSNHAPPRPRLAQVCHWAAVRPCSCISRCVKHMDPHSPQGPMSEDGHQLCPTSPLRVQQVLQPLDTA